MKLLTNIVILIMFIDASSCVRTKIIEEVSTPPEGDKEKQAADAVALKVSLATLNGLRVDIESKTTSLSSFVAGVETDNDAIVRLDNDIKQLRLTDPLFRAINRADSKLFVDIHEKIHALEKKIPTVNVIDLGEKIQEIADSADREQQSLPESSEVRQLATEVKSFAEIARREIQKIQRIEKDLQTNKNVLDNKINDASKDFDVLEGSRAYNIDDVKTNLKKDISLDDVSKRLADPRFTDLATDVTTANSLVALAQQRVLDLLGDAVATGIVKNAKDELSKIDAILARAITNEKDVEDAAQELDLLLGTANQLETIARKWVTTSAEDQIRSSVNLLLNGIDKPGGKITSYTSRVTPKLANPLLTIKRLLFVANTNFNKPAAQADLTSALNDKNIASATAATLRANLLTTSKQQDDADKDELEKAKRYDDLNKLFNEGIDFRDFYDPVRLAAINAAIADAINPKASIYAKSYSDVEAVLKRITLDKIEAIINTDDPATSNDMVKFFKNLNRLTTEIVSKAIENKIKKDSLNNFVLQRMAAIEKQFFKSSVFVPLNLAIKNFTDEVSDPDVLKSKDRATVAALLIILCNKHQPLLAVHLKQLPACGNYPSTTYLKGTVAEKFNEQITKDSSGIVYLTLPKILISKMTDAYEEELAKVRAAKLVADDALKEKAPPAGAPPAGAPPAGAPPAGAPPAGAPPAGAPPAAAPPEKAPPEKAEDEYLDVIAGFNAKALAKPATDLGKAAVKAAATNMFTTRDLVAATVDFFKNIPLVTMSNGSTYSYVDLFRLLESQLHPSMSATDLDDLRAKLDRKSTHPLKNFYDFLNSAVVTAFRNSFVVSDGEMKVRLREAALGRLTTATGEPAGVQDFADAKLALVRAKDEIEARDAVRELAKFLLDAPPTKNFKTKLNSIATTAVATRIMPAGMMANIITRVKANPSYQALQLLAALAAPQLSSTPIVPKTPPDNSSFAERADAIPAPMRTAIFSVGIGNIELEVAFNDYLNEVQNALTTLHADAIHGAKVIVRKPDLVDSIVRAFSVVFLELITEMNSLNFNGTNDVRLQEIHKIFSLATIAKYVTFFKGFRSVVTDYEDFLAKPPTIQRQIIIDLQNLQTLLNGYSGTLTVEINDFKKFINDFLR